jgi:LysR family nitrogen assimilation transcriptional regulator
MIDRITLFRNYPLDMRHECLSLHSLFSGLELGLGATLISKFSALPLWRQGKVVCRPVVEPVVSRQLCIASSSERPVTTAQKVVMDIAARCVNEAVASGDWPDTRSLVSTD